MAWLRLTLQGGRTCRINTDQVSGIYDSVPGHSALDHNAEIRLHDGLLTIVRESVDEIAGMIEDAEWRKKVLAVACAIMSNEHSNGLTSEQVWARAVRFAREPVRPPQTATRLEDLQLIVAQTLERLMGLQRYAMALKLYLGVPPDTSGDWLQADEMTEAIKDLRRAMGDCTLDDEG